MEGQWIVIVAANNKIFARLTKAMGREELIKEPRFTTIANRARNAKVINELVAEWAKNYPFGYSKGKLRVPLGATVNLDESYSLRIQDNINLKPEELCLLKFFSLNCN